jgi:hypothetical protein
VEVKTCQEERHAVLGPYLHQLEVMTRSGDTDGSSEIELGFRSLHLDSWESPRAAGCRAQRRLVFVACRGGSVPVQVSRRDQHP